jgi:hypothetical protein
VRLPGTASVGDPLDPKAEGKVKGVDRIKISDRKLIEEIVDRVVKAEERSRKDRRDVATTRHPAACAERRNRARDPQRLEGCRFGSGLDVRWRVPRASVGT